MLAAQMHASGFGFEDAMSMFEAAYAVEVLSQHNGNQCAAAGDMGIHRNTMARIIARGQRWVEVWRLNEGKIPHRVLDEIGQALATESLCDDMMTSEKRRA